MKKVSKKRYNLLLLLLIFLLAFSLFQIYSGSSEIVWYTQIEKNDHYNGEGQKNGKAESGYPTVFVTAEENQKTYKEYQQNGEAPWADNAYWGGKMWENGCGITAIATILSGYGIEKTPEDLRQEYYPVLEGDDIPKVLQQVFGLANSGFFYDSSHLSQEYLLEYLKSNRPVLICVWDKPKKNRWTEASHYMVLLAADGMENVYVSNPNGTKEDNNRSGWYPISEITPYLAKALFIENQ